MKNIYSISMLLIGFLLQSYSFADISAQVDLNSRYVWRGIGLSQGSVLQPSITFSPNDYYFTVWGNYVLNQEANQNQFNEIDLSAGFSREWNLFKIEPLLQFYFYPFQTSPDTGEFSLKLSYPIGGVGIFTTQNLDIAKYSGSYYGELGLSYLQGSVYLGWGSSKFNEAYLTLSKDAINLVGINFSIPFGAAGCDVNSHFSYTSLIDSDLRSVVPDSDIFCFGIIVNKEF